MLVSGLYIHYYYKHNNSLTMAYDVYSNELAKADAREKLAKFNQAKQQYIDSIELQELSEMYEYLTTDASAADREEIFGWAADPMKETSNKIVFESDGDILSAGSIAARQAQLEKSSSELLNQMTSFKEALESLLSEAVQKLTGKDCYEQYAAAILTKYCNSKGLSGADATTINQSIINDFLSRDGLKSLKSISGAPQTSLNKLILAAQALPVDGSYATSYDSKSVTNGRIENLPQFFKIISQKVQGQWSNIAGRSQEMGVLAAEQALAQKASEAFSNLDFVGVGGDSANFEGKDVSVTIKASKYLSNGLEVNANPSIMKSANSSQILISQDNVTVNYGIQAPDNGLSPNVAKPYTDVNFVRTANFASALVKSLGANSLNSIYNLIGGHGDGQEYTNDGITQEWNKVKNYVVVTSIVDMVAGLPAEHAYIFVSGGKPYDVSDVMSKVIDTVTNSDSNKSSFVNMVTRETILKQNRWYSHRGDARPGEQRDTYDAIYRSNKAIAAITGYLNKATITLNLNQIKM